MHPRTLPRRLAGSLHLSGEVETAARSVLGPDHPLARAISRQRTLAIQLAVTTVAAVLGGLGILDRGQSALAVLVAASLVGLVLVVSTLCARGIVRDRAQEVIAAGSDADALPVVVRERRRLAARTQRERLAVALERYLRDAERWFEIFPPYRPPHEVRCLRLVAAEVRDVVELLRDDSSHVRGVAATARFLTDGSASPLFRGDVELLRRELDRLRSLLSFGRQAWPAHLDRVAA